MKVVLYVRVSTAEQAKEGYSIGEQIERLKKYCEAMGWIVVAIFVDPSYSGGDMNRPGLRDMIKTVQDEDIDKVVVYKLDRLSRSQKDTLYLIEDVFLANQTDFVSMNENFDTSSPFGRAMIGILAVFAQLEREQIKERMGMGKEARAKEGKWHGGSTEPIGFDYNPATEELVANDYEIMQIKELAELFLNGTPLRTIETMFEEMGYTHKYGKWDSKTMRRVLRNKIYIKMIKHRDEWYPGNQARVFDDKTFEKINKLLDARAEMYKLSGVKPGAQTTYLGGLILCKHCGGKYAKNSWPQRNGSRTTVYGCYSRMRKMKKMIKDPNCKNKYWKMDELDNLVFDEIRKLAFDPEYFNEVKRYQRDKTAEEPGKIAILEKEIAKVDEQISRFMDLYGIGKFTIDQVSQKVDPLNETRNKLVKELEALNAESGRLTEEEAREIIDSFEDIAETEDFNKIRLMIESLINYIEIDNEDVYIHWKFA